MILSELTELITFWFKNENYWFNATKEMDAIIIEKFYGLLNVSVNTEDHEEYLGWILVYDQLVRHFYRNREVSNVYHNIAYNLAEKALKLENYYSPEQRIFILLPFRHGTVKDKEFALKTIKEYRTNDSNNSYYRRFFQATVRDLAKINNESFKENNSTNSTFSPNVLDDSSSYKRNWVSGFLSYFYTPKPPDFKPELKMSEEYDLLLKMKKEFRNLPKQIVISLSGGVDSTLCSYILKMMNFDVIAVTINYNNRDSSAEEMNFVKWWCNQINIPLYIRKITEINRSREQDREFYESITKEIRFNCYKKIGRPVVLGHNKNDSIENIFSNIKKMRSLDNLLGMGFYTVIKEVEIYRPILSFSKQEIYSVANFLKMPYLYDSTPKWSERGKYRDSLIPFINNFDPEILERLIEFSKINEDKSRTFDQMVFNSYDFNILEGKMVINYNYNGYSYWKKIFENRKIKISNKSIINLVKRIENSSFGIIHLSKDLTAELKYGTLILN